MHDKINEKIQSKKMHDKINEKIQKMCSVKKKKGFVRNKFRSSMVVCTSNMCSHQFFYLRRNFLIYVVFYLRHITCACQLPPSWFFCSSHGRLCPLDARMCLHCLFREKRKRFLGHPAHKHVKKHCTLNRHDSGRMNIVTHICMFPASGQGRRESHVSNPEQVIIGQIHSEIYSVLLHFVPENCTRHMLKSHLGVSRFKQRQPWCFICSKWLCFRFAYLTTQRVPLILFFASWWAKRSGLLSHDLALFFSNDSLTGF